MEHRWSLRKQIQRRVSLEFLQTGPLVVTLRDISLGGMFVDNTPVSLPVNAVGTVSFSLLRGDSQEHFRLEATVIHQTRTGAGLMFLDTETEVVRTLRGVLATGGVNGSGNLGEWPTVSHAQILSNA